MLLAIVSGSVGSCSVALGENYVKMRQYGWTWLSEISQAEKDKYHMISLIRGI